MDCDGPKHALIRDGDGRFVGTYPILGSIIPFAELRYVTRVQQCLLIKQLSV